MVGTVETTGAAGVAPTGGVEPSGSSSSESSITTFGADGAGWVHSPSRDPKAATSSIPSSPPGTTGARAAGAGAPKDVGDRGVGADDGGNGVLLDDATVANWSGDYASSRRGTLWGRLRPAVFFLIFGTRFGNRGCRFTTSGPD